jgi:UDP-N-acetylmuramoyl-L-alanyl-D-glutamate--2,6-diaminopimelate ligase
VILDRHGAIVAAVCEAAPEDVVLVAGKGHEDYQEVQGVKHHFSDAEVVREAFIERKTRESK